MDNYGMAQSAGFNTRFARKDSVHFPLLLLVERHCAAQFHLLPVLTRDEDLARLGAFGRADDTAVLDLVDDTRGTRIAQLQTALQHGCGCLAAVHDDLDGFLYEFILIVAQIVRAAAAAALVIAHLLGLLLDVLNKLVDRGNTVIVIEHNLDVIKVADHIIDIGPEGGAAGGEIVAAGTPHEIACAPRSYTGEFLKKLGL